MVQTLVVTPMRAQEKECARNVLLASYAQYEESFRATGDWEEYVKEMSASIDNPNVKKVLLAKDETGILGCLQLFTSGEKAYEIKDITIDAPVVRFLGVLPTARGKGVARALLVEALRFTKEASAPSLYLHTSDRMEAAIRLYTKFGFQRDESKEFYKGETLVKCYRYDLVE